MRNVRFIFPCIETHIFTLHLAFACTFPDCGKDFSRKDNLQKHDKTAHRDKDVPPNTEEGSGVAEEDDSNCSNDRSS